MSTANRHFDLLQDQEKAARIRGLLFSPAWTEDFVPHFLALRNTLNAQLLDPSQARKDNAPDDYLRARIATLDELLNLGHGFLAEYDATRRQAEEIAKVAQEYQARTDLGQLAPRFVYPAGY